MEHEELAVPKIKQIYFELRENAKNETFRFISNKIGNSFFLC